MAQIDNSRKYLSILMPIYNASRYLKRALDSVIKQTLDNIEIICINDGSTDDSLGILEHYAERDKRITIINKNNSGYGDSMNRGLSVAHGAYIAILEPDDWYEPDMLETLYDLASKHRLDVIKGDFYQHSNQTGNDRQYNLFSKDQCDKVLDNNKDTFIYSLQPSIWSAIYKQNFLKKNNIKFLATPGASYQDTSFNFKVFATAKRVMFVNKSLLHYRIDNSQSSINNIAKKLPNIDKEYDEIDEFIINNRLNALETVAATCRYKTYLWAMEQLRGKQLRKYIYHVSHIMSLRGQSMINSHSINHNTMWLIIKHPSIYYLQKELHLSAHRAKKSFINFLNQLTH